MKSSRRQHRPCVREKFVEYHRRFLLGGERRPGCRHQSQRACRVMMKEEGDSLTFAIADRRSSGQTDGYLQGRRAGQRHDAGRRREGCQPRAAHLEINTLESYGKTFTATVQTDTSGTITVAGVTQPADVRVGSGTSVDDMKKLLPTQVEVSLSDLSSQNVAVVWNTAPTTAAWTAGISWPARLLCRSDLKIPTADR